VTPHLKNVLVGTDISIPGEDSYNGSLGMDYRKTITVEPDKMGGKPCIRGLRITVYDVLDYLPSGMTGDGFAFASSFGIR
jgi:hypothetical protein